MSLPAESSETLPEPVTGDDPHARWRFFRDVLVFQLKLLLGNLHNFIFVPISLGAAAIDLLLKSGTQGSRFYRTMEWAKDAEHAIGLYSALDGEDQRARRAYSVDAVVARVEQVIVREYEKGGTAASVKAAVDRTLDKMQHEMPAKYNPEEIVKLAAEKIREKMQRRRAETAPQPD